MLGFKSKSKPLQTNLMVDRQHQGNPKQNRQREYQGTPKKGDSSRGKPGYGHQPETSLEASSAKAVDGELAEVLAGNEAERVCQVEHHPTPLLSDFGYLGVQTWFRKQASWDPGDLVLVFVRWSKETHWKTAVPCLKKTRTRPLLCL